MTSEGRLAGRVALVTGAAEGIGRAFAVRLAEEGADIAIADVQPGDVTAGLVEAAGRRAFSRACDISDPDQVTDFVAAASAELGPIDILVNNAAIYPRQDLEDIDIALWRRVMAVNVDAIFLLVKAISPSMIDRGWGRIVNITSGSFWSAGRHRMTAYITSKAAVVGLTRGLSGDFGPSGITVNAIAPGMVLTDHARAAAIAGPDGIARFERFAELQSIPRPEVPEDMCGALAFLVSDDAAFITGQTLSVDGGHVRL